MGYLQYFPTFQVRFPTFQHSRAVIKLGNAMMKHFNADAVDLCLQTT